MRKFALLFSGGVTASANNARYLNDLREMYRTLVSTCGFKKEDIWTLYADGSPHDLDGDGQSEINWPGTAHHFVLVTQAHLPARLTSNDLLYFFTTNHGSPGIASQQAGTGIWMWESGPGKLAWMSAAEVARLIQLSKFSHLVVCMGQCFSGGFIADAFAEISNCVIATACRHDEPSWACDSEGPFDEFLYHWTAAVRGRTPQGTPVNGDIDGDGRTSIRDAFDYARLHDSRPETPQYWESAPGLGHRLSLTGDAEKAS